MWVSKDGIHPTNVWPNESSGKRVVAFSFPKSGLIESIPLEPDASISTNWYINNCLSQIYDVISQRREQTGLCGVILHDDNG